MASLEPDILVIELAELPPETEATAELVVPLAEPAPTVSAEAPPSLPEPIEASSAAAPDPATANEPQRAEPQTPTVLTQLDAASVGPAPDPSSAAAGETPSGETSGHAVTPAQIASALEQMHCLKLKRHEEGACPPPDPFAVAMAAAERDIPPERLFGDPRYIAKTVSDKIFEAEAANRFLWPDEDLFSDPLAPGAYNARRIRNGQEPLWSQDMRDGFRKSE